MIENGIVERYRELGFLEGVVDKKDEQIISLMIDGGLRLINDKELKKLNKYLNGYDISSVLIASIVNVYKFYNVIDYAIVYVDLLDWIIERKGIIKSNNDIVNAKLFLSYFSMKHKLFDDDFRGRVLILLKDEKDAEMLKISNKNLDKLSDFVSCFLYAKDLKYTDREIIENSYKIYENLKTINYF